MNTTVQTITIDAAGKRPGRLASEIAHILNGKDSAAYMPNKVPEVRVEVSNASRMQIDEKKKAGKIYERYTGYFGGRRETTLGRLLKQKGYSEVLRKAIYGMLPDNRLRAVKMKKVRIHE